MKIAHTEDACKLCNNIKDPKEGEIGGQVNKKIGGLKMEQRASKSVKCSKEEEEDDEEMKMTQKKEKKEMNICIFYTSLT